MSTAISKISFRFPSRLLVAAAVGVMGFLWFHPFVPSEPGEIVPCRIGSYWIYDSVTREQVDEKAPQTVTTKLKLTVIDAIRRPGIDTSLIERRDLSGREPVSYNVRLVFDNNRYYEYDLSDEERLDTWSKLKNLVAAGKRPDTPEESSLQMVLPGKVGTKWDEESTPGRKDNMYCWYVESTRALPASTEIAGVHFPQSTTEYTVAFRTCPDHQIRKFVPGIGFIDTQYRHHGTICDSDEHLVEFHGG
ncbi:MAG: hypothetical protein K2X93_16350 [Candidatus Obscuribacterales bacterium]|nr:hypothetical protein [Candidatus Obscuribacterales bacterium]